MKNFFIIKFSIFSISAFCLGIIFNKIFSSSNIFKMPFYEIIYEVPYVYSLNLLEILFILFLTSFIGWILFLYFYKSRTSRKEVFEITKIILLFEIIIFLFIYGTYFSFLNKNLSILLKEYFIHISLIAIIVVIFIYIERIEKKDENEEEIVLYKSREVFLKPIDEYLQTKNIKSFSIIGEWGIGKTVLINSFFNHASYKNKYERIYIDASIYSNNQKIIETLENELDLLFKKYGILRINNSFIDTIFLQNNNFFKSVFLSIKSKNTLENARNGIKERVEEIEKKGKKIVICLDNLERLGSSTIIKNLFAIVDEIFPDIVKKIYLYHEKEMDVIFEEKNFIDYISKYTFNKIELKKVETNEILEKNEELKKILDNFNKRCIDPLFSKNFKTKIEKITVTSERSYIGTTKFYENNIKKLHSKITIIKETLKNPRYIHNLEEYLKSDRTDIEELRYKFEYKLIIDFFPNLRLDDIQASNMTFQKLLPNIANLMLSNEKKDISMITLNDQEISKLCIIYLFKFDNDGEVINEIYLQNEIFEALFDNKSKDKTELQRELKNLEHDKDKNLFKILNLIYKVNPNNDLEKINKFLEENKEIKYIINSEKEIREIIFFPNLEEISKNLFPLLQIKKFYPLNSDFNNLFIYFLLKNEYSKFLLQFIIPEPSYEKLKEKNNDNGLIGKLNKEFESNKDDLAFLNISENVKKALNTFEEFQKIEKIELTNEDEDEEIVKNINNKFFKQENNVILSSIKIERGQSFNLFSLYFPCHPNFDEGKIEITKDKIDKYINLFKDKSKDKELEAGVLYLLIELIKFRRELIKFRRELIKIKRKIKKSKRKIKKIKRKIIL